MYGFDSRRLIETMKLDCNPNSGRLLFPLGFTRLTIIKGFLLSSNPHPMDPVSISMEPRQVNMTYTHPNHLPDLSSDTDDTPFYYLYFVLTVIECLGGERHRGNPTVSRYFESREIR